MVIEYSNGNKAWFIDGKLHRSDGPAVEHNDGYKAWFVQGKRHRLNGPALDDPILGITMWYINGQESTKETIRVIDILSRRWKILTPYFKALK